MTDDQAEMMALQVLGWMAADKEVLEGFLAQSGIGAADLRTRAGDKDVLAGVMAYLLAWDDRILAASAALGVAPAALSAAANHLTGEVPHWT